MPFCAQCGAEGQGNFCPSCGAPRASGTARTSTARNAGELDNNVVATLCYVLGLLTGILFLVLEPYNRNREVRFHALQSICVSVAFFLISSVLMLFTAIPFFGWLIALLALPALYLAGFGLWLALMYRAYTGQRWVLPIVGPIAERQA